MGWYKHLILVFVVMGLIVYSGVLTIQQNNTTRSSLEVEGALKTALLGELRTTGNESGISKEEFIGEVIGSVVNTQKNHGKNIQINYVFLDKSGNATEVDEQIQSIQYEILVMGNNKNEEGVYPVQSKAVNRISIEVGG